MVGAIVREEELGGVLSGRSSYLYISEYLDSKLEGQKFMEFLVQLRRANPREFASTTKRLHSAGGTDLSWQAGCYRHSQSASQ